MRAIIADTGPLYAQADRSDQYYQRAQTELAQINREKLAILIPYPIYLEAHKLILYTGGFKVSTSFTERIITQANLLNPSERDYQTAIQLIARFPDQRITLFDAIVAVLALELKLPVWTYDYHFGVMGVPTWGYQ